MGVYLALQAGASLLLLGPLSRLRSPCYSERLRALTARAGEPGEPLTVVMVGSSRTLFGLRGSAVEERLSAEAGRPVIVYNFGLCGAGPVTSLLTVRRMLADGVRPGLLLVEVFPALLGKDDPLDEAREGLLPTAGLRRDEIYLLRPHLEGRRTLRESDWWSAWAMPLYAHRFGILSRVAPTLLHFTDRKFGFAGADASGWLPVHPGTASAEGRPGALRLAEREYRPRLARLEPGGPPVAALRQTLALCRAEGIDCALVLMPEGPAFRGWMPERNRVAVVRLLDSLREEFGVAVINGREWPESEAHFIDSHHLTPDGATWFTERLAAEALLPLLARQDTGRAIARR